MPLSQLSGLSENPPPGPTASQLLDRCENDDVSHDTCPTQLVVAAQSAMQLGSAPDGVRSSQFHCRHLVVCQNGLI